MYTSYIDPALQGFKGNVNIAGGHPFTNTVNPYLTQGFGAHQPMINAINPYLTQGLGIQQPIHPGMIPQNLFGYGLGHVNPYLAQGINPLVGRQAFPYPHPLAFGGVDPRFAPVATQGWVDMAQKEALLREAQKLHALNCCVPYEGFGFGAPLVRVI